MSAGCVAIVDAVSSGSLYAAELAKRGYDSIHVQSIDPFPPDDLPSFVPHDHIANLVFDGDLERSVRALREYAPRCVIPGAENGVRLADRLSVALGVANNGLALGDARRNKFAMQNAVAAAGLPAIPSRMSHRWDDVADWVSNNLPVVVKPPASGGTDHVSICTTTADAKHAFESIVGHINTFCELNEHALVQTLLRGTEYIVNHASCDGQHYVTDIWRVDKVRSGTPVYDRGVLLPSRGELQDRMVPYVQSVLDALGIRFGASHTELMLTDDGPIFIEVAARLHGQSPQPLCEKVMGFSQITATLDAYLAPKSFAERAKRPYELQRHVQRVELICPRSGTLRTWPGLDAFRKLPSFYKLAMNVFPDQPIFKTIDLMTSPGYIDLIHEDPDVIEQDHQRLRAWEVEGLYDIAPAG